MGDKAMFFLKKSGKKIDAFAGQLAQQIASKYPPEFDTGSKKAIPEKRLTRILEEVFIAARAFKDENKLGLYKKARLSNSFRWELTKLGYTAEFIELATEGMVVYITRKNEQEKEKAEN